MDRRSAIKQTALLSGITLSPGLLTTILSSCNSNNESTAPPEFYPKEILSDIGQMADDIIPRTDTPGASDVGVDKFVDIVTKNCLDTGRQQLLLSLFSGIKEEYNSAYHKNEETERHGILSKLEEESYSSSTGQSYRLLKSIILMGYFTSEEGLKSNLNYKPVPGKYEGCITISKDDKVLIGGRV